MKIGAVFIALSLISIPLFATGATVDKFQGGNAEAVADLSGPGHSADVNFILPAQCYAMNATMKVSDVATQGVYPLAPKISLNDTLLWAFNGTGYGTFGRQDSFSGGTVQPKIPFGAGGGTNRAAIRLPKGAFVQNATLDVNVSWPMARWGELVNFTGAAAGDELGKSVSSAGDVNNDGYDDVIVGAYHDDSGGTNAGRAFIYFGGQTTDNTPDVTLTGAAADDEFGCSVSNAGDVNNDSYEDIIVGASQNDTAGSNSGCAYLYFGGPNMDNIADLILRGDGTNDHFGHSVSGAGDVNNDGYDDIFVGTSGANNPGHASIYFGGPNMDNVADVNLTGAARYDLFGYSISEAGDVNNDGYDDVMVGAAFNDAGGFNAGRAYVYFGGPNMDNVPDVNLTGAGENHQFGYSVSGAGDMNNDGYDDVVAGAPQYGLGGQATGYACIYFGGSTMDNTADIILTGLAANDELGYSVSGACDFNKDGYDDVIVGAIQDNVRAGRACVYFGGPNVDNVADIIFAGAAADDRFGNSVSGAGDVNNDGHTDIIIGAPRNDSKGSNAGRAYINSLFVGVKNSSITVGSNPVWNMAGYFNGTDKTNDFSDALNEHLRSAAPSGNDGYGNSYVDVPINVSAESEGNITLFNLNIIYQYNATVPDFAAPLNNYISNHKGERDANGNITVPIMVRSQSGGKLKLYALSIIYDGAPFLDAPFPRLEMDEDTINTTLLDMYQYFRDEYDSDSALDFSIESATNSSIVNASISGNRYLSADALTGGENDNWTGVVSLRIRCANSYGFSTSSEPFDIVIRNMNDPPVIMSIPPANATSGVDFIYQLTVADGDNDTLNFSLAQMPGNMTISKSGRITWMPPRSGRYIVSAAVGDRQATAYQNFTLEVPNSLPKFSSTPATNASVGIQYDYEAKAVDDDGDVLAFSLYSAPEGMSIDSTTGMLLWMPANAGTYDVSLSVYDGIEEAHQNFSINVSANHAPLFTSIPVTDATFGVQYLYDARAIDDDNDTINFSIITKPAGMSIDSATGRILWTPQASQTGNNTVIIKVADGRGGGTEQTFLISVISPARPKCAITSPSNGTKVSGMITIQGTATNGGANIVSVHVRADGGTWMVAINTDNWTCNVDTAGLKNGPHNFEARAFDGVNYSGPASVTLVVNNPQPYVFGGNDFWWFFLVAVSIAVAAAGLIFWMARRSGPSK